MKARKLLPLLVIPFLTGCGKIFAGSEGGNILDYGLKYANAQNFEYQTEVTINEKAEISGASYGQNFSFIEETVDSKTTLYSMYTNQPVCTYDSTKVFDFYVATLIDDISLYTLICEETDGFYYVFDDFGNLFVSLSGAELTPYLEKSYLPRVRLISYYSLPCVSIERYSADKGYYVENYIYNYINGLGDKVSFADEALNYSYSQKLAAPYNDYSVFFDEYNGMIYSFRDGAYWASFCYGNYIDTLNSSSVYVVGRTLFFQKENILGRATDESIVEYTYNDGSYKVQLETIAFDIIDGSVTTGIYMPYYVYYTEPMCDKNGNYTLAAAYMEEIRKDGSYKDMVRIIDESLVLHDDVTENDPLSFARVGSSLLNTVNGVMYDSDNKIVKSFDSNYTPYCVFANYVVVRDNNTSLLGVLNQNGQVVQDFIFNDVECAYDDSIVFVKGSDLVVFNKDATLENLDMSKIELVEQNSDFGDVYLLANANDFYDLKLGHKTIKQNICNLTGSVVRYHDILSYYCEETKTEVYCLPTLTNGTGVTYNAITITIK